MGVFSGPADWWTDGTNEGRTHIATKGVIQDGIVLNLDAGASTSYPGSGTTWTDLSGNSNNGTLTNGPTFSSADGGSIVFDGSNDYVTIPDSDDFTFGSQNFTIDAWIYPTATGSFPSFISKYAGSSTNSTFFFSLGNSNQTLEFYLYNGVGGQQAILQSGTVSLNAWNYVVAVRVGNRVATYLNGVEVASTTWTYSVYDANVNVTVGSGQYNGAFYFNGRISNTRILKGKGLTAAEVEQNYNALKGRFGI